jgi:hypothetical protein
MTAVLLARRVWPEYAAAEPTKAYSLVMLISRLSAGALCTACAAVVTTMVARDRGQAAWWLGVLFLAVSLPSHLFQVWADYPAWYHVVYLSYLVPIAGLIGRVARDRRVTPSPAAAAAR